MSNKIHCCYCGKDDLLPATHEEDCDYCRDCEEIANHYSGVEHDTPSGFHYGMDSNGNRGYFEDFEESIGE